MPRYGIHNFLRSSQRGILNMFADPDGYMDRRYVSHCLYSTKFDRMDRVVNWNAMAVVTIRNPKMKPLIHNGRRYRRG